MRYASRGTGVKLQATRASSPAALRRRRVAIEPVEITAPALHAGVQRILQHVPLEALLVLPLAPLAEFPAHEQQLLARMGPHVAEQQPQAGELLPLIPGHLADERALAVHHLIVRQRQDEVLVEGVPEAEGEAAVVILAVQGILLEVLEDVVHPD